VLWLRDALARLNVADPDGLATQVRFWWKARFIACADPRRSRHGRCRQGGRPGAAHRGRRARSRRSPRAHAADRREAGPANPRQARRRARRDLVYLDVENSALPLPNLRSAEQRNTDATSRRDAVEPRFCARLSKRNLAGEPRTGRSSRTLEHTSSL